MDECKSLKEFRFTVDDLGNFDALLGMSRKEVSEK